MSSHHIFRPAHSSVNNSAANNSAIVNNSMAPDSTSQNCPTVAHINSANNWLGGSGKIYAASEIEVKDFILNDSSIYVLVSQKRAIWIGTARDLIEDSASRSQFRQSIKLASSAFEIHSPRHQNQRFGLIADLLAGHLAPTSFAA